MRKLKRDPVPNSVPNPMKRLLIIYHSSTGATEQMANAVANGARSAVCGDGENNIAVKVLHASTAGPDDLLAADAYIFAAPENLAARQIERIATGWRLQAISPTLIICTHAQSTEAILAPKIVSNEDLSRGEELGATLAAGMAIGAF